MTSSVDTSFPFNVDVAPAPLGGLLLLASLTLLPLLERCGDPG
jgi:hypothetical protein